MRKRYTILLLFVFCLLQGTLLSAQGTRYIVRDGSMMVSPGEGAYMGVYLDGISQKKARELGFKNLYGSYIKKVITGTPADRAGLRALDYIYGVDAYRTGAEQSLSDILDRYRAGDRAKLIVQRGERFIKLDIIFGSRQEEERRSITVTPCQDPFLGVMMRNNSSREGGIIVDVVNGSTADKMGLEDGFEILRINGYRILDWKDLTSAIDDTEVGEEIKVLVWNGRSRVERSYPIQSRCAFEQAEDEISIYTGDENTIIRTNTEIVSNGRSLMSESMSGSEVQRANRKYGLSLKSDQSLPLNNIYFNADFDEEELDLSFVLPKRGNTQVRVYNTNGRVIYDFDLGDFSGTFKDRTNLLKNEPGDFFLEVSQNGQSMVHKIEIRD